MLRQEPRDSEIAVRNRLEDLQLRIDERLERYLHTTGSDRQQLTVELLRLKWELEDLIPGTRSRSKTTEARPPP